MTITIPGNTNTNIPCMEFIGEVKIRIVLMNSHEINGFPHLFLGLVWLFPLQRHIKPPSCSRIQKAKASTEKRRNLVDDRKR